MFRAQRPRSDYGWLNLVLCRRLESDVAKAGLTFVYCIRRYGVACPRTVLRGRALAAG
jgi:hypothetical protein